MKKKKKREEKLACGEIELTMDHEGRAVFCEQKSGRWRTDWTRCLAIRRRQVF